MRSSSGAHFIALDHVRAVAAFIVFVWHFTHAWNGYPVPYEYAPALFPFSILDEGHTGVALFMTLSGYLFAKLLDGKSGIIYRAFIWNRALRLLPLLLVVIITVGITKLVNGESLSIYALSIAQGFLFPSLPNGGWSITVEFHYYLILPLLLLMFKKSKLLPLLIVFSAIALRTCLFFVNGEIQTLAYWTLIGRIDQFVLGMVVYSYRFFIANRHFIVLLTITVFMYIFWRFDLQGGFYKNPSYPSPSKFWIIIPTIEGVAYSIGIAWYDNSFSTSSSKFSKLIGRIGEYSYSIYLLHFFVVFYAARFVNERIMDISEFYLASLWAVVFFALMIIPGYLSYRFIESPFLKLRKRYVKVLDGTEENRTVSTD